MFNLFKSQKPDQYVSVDTDDDYIIEGNILKSIYKTKLRPLEEHYHFHQFHMPPLQDSDFVLNSMLLIIGDSVGRRRFLKQITNVDVASTLNRANVPLDECFNAYVFGEEEDTISGSMLVFDSAKPFRPLATFGLDFLNHFEGTAVSSPFLETLSIIDAPNVLKKDSIEIDGHMTDIDQYDITPAFDWFCRKAERILLFFDANIITISDANRRLIEKYPQKVAIVLDNTDMNTQKLMRAYGMLMFTLAKIVTSPTDLIRVHVGPLSVYRLRYPINQKLFQDERRDFFRDLESVHRSAAHRQLSKFLERARLAKVHAFIINELYNEMKPAWMKERKKLELCKNLQTIFNKVQRDQNASAEDFPDLKKMQISLQEFDFKKLSASKPELVELFDDKVVYNVNQYMNAL